jgi:CRP-like cAMP-binding protein
MVEPPLLIILTGHASVLVPFRGRDVEVATAGPGAILGDISFLLGEPASATVIPIAEVEAIGAEQSEIRSHLATDPVLASEFFQTLAVLQAQRTHARDAQLIQLQMLGEGAF